MKKKSTYRYAFISIVILVSCIITTKCTAQNTYNKLPTNLNTNTISLESKSDNGIGYAFLPQSWVRGDNQKHLVSGAVISKT